MSKKKYEPEGGIYPLSEKIEKLFKQFGDNIEILDWKSYENRVRYRVKLKGNTRQADILAHAPDIQCRLKLPLFQVYKEGFSLYIITSDKDMTYPRLPKILNDSTYDEVLEEMELPYIVGHNALGQPVIVDLSTFPHLLLGGSTNSGKSIGLQALVTALICMKCPADVNLILIDVGAGDLIGFEGVPHLSCPVVRDHDTACNTLTALKDEMERRVKLEHTSADELKRLPRLVLVVDEFPALLTGMNDKKALKSLVNTISSLLQRGRHAKIHLIIAAQNPTFNSMKVDLGNITARIAFRCAKKNFSETILGEGGAENLSGSGSLLLKSPQNNGLEWIQGIYIKSKDIQRITQELKSHQYFRNEMDNKFDLIVPVSIPTETEDNLSSCLQQFEVTAALSEQESLLAAVIFWALGKDYISVNTLMREYHLGWNRAAGLVQQLEKLGIVDKLNGKQSRYVRPRSFNDLPDEMVKFMEYCDYPRNSIICAFQERRTSS